MKTTWFISRIFLEMYVGYEFHFTRCAFSTTSKTESKSNPRWYSKELKNQKLAVTNAKRNNPSEYPSLRNRYVNATRRAKRAFVRNAALKNRKQGGVWKVVNKKPSSTNWDPLINNGPYKDPADIANAFADHFQNKVKSLQLTPSADKLMNQLTEIHAGLPTWDIKPCSREDVSHAIDGLKPSASSGVDNISNRLIKTLKFEALDALTFVFNRSIDLRVFPSCWKQGRIKPIFKKGSRSCLGNYRPICLMSNIGKLLEAVILNQLTCHLESIFPNNMFGFRPGRSTTNRMAIHEV